MPFHGALDNYNTKKMKTKLSTLLLLTALIAGLSFNCSDIIGVDCDSKGYIQVTNNTKSNKNYKVIIDGMNYGTLAPGQGENYKVNIGAHLVSIEFQEGGAACSAAYVDVQECQTRGLSCES